MSSHIVTQESGLSLMVAARAYKTHPGSEGSHNRSQWQFWDLQRVPLPLPEGDTLTDTKIPERRTFTDCGGYTERHGLVTSHSGFTGNSIPLFARYSPNVSHWLERRDELLLWTIDPATGLCTLTQTVITDAVFESPATPEGGDSFAARILTGLERKMEGNTGPLGKLTFSVEDLRDGGGAERSLLLQHRSWFPVHEAGESDRRDLGFVLAGSHALSAEARHK